MDREELIRRVSELDLPIGEYCVVGSGPLAVRSLCDATDIDLLVSGRIYEQLKEKDAWVESANEEGVMILSNPPYEVGHEYRCGEYLGEPETLFDEVDVVDGVAFASLEQVMQYKRARGKQKDQQDIALVNEYLFEHPDDDLLI